MQTHIPLDSIKSLDLLLAAMLPPVVVKMCFPLLCRDALSYERAHVVADVGQEYVETAKRTLKVEDEVGALLVRNGGVRVIGVFANLEIDDETLVLGPVDVLLEGILEGLVTDEEGEAAICWCVEELQEDTFDVCRPAFVEPEVRRVSLSE